MHIQLGILDDRDQAEILLCLRILFEQWLIIEEG